MNDLPGLRLHATVPRESKIYHVGAAKIYPQFEKGTDTMMIADGRLQEAVRVQTCTFQVPFKERPRLKPTARGQTCGLQYAHESPSKLKSPSSFVISQGRVLNTWGALSSPSTIEMRLKSRQRRQSDTPVTVLLLSDNTGGALPDFFFLFSFFPAQQTTSGIGHRVK